MVIYESGGGRTTAAGAGVTDGAIVSWHAFVRGTLGIIGSPYQSVRRIVARADIREVWWILMCVAVYFGTVSLIRVSAFHPFLLTRHFFKLFIAMIGVWAVMSGVIYTVSRFLGGEGEIRQVAVGWAYTLVPTLGWFLMTSILSVILPPPRTTSLAGTAFSLLFLGLSAVLFYWKFMITYLVIRFAMRLDLGRIVVVVSIVVPFALTLSVLLNHWGIFRVPFI